MICLMIICMYTLKTASNLSFFFLFCFFFFCLLSMNSMLLFQIKAKDGNLTSPKTNGPRQAILVLIAYASSEGSGEPAHPRSLARTSAARSYKQ